MALTDIIILAVAVAAVVVGIVNKNLKKPVRIILIVLGAVVGTIVLLLLMATGLLLWGID